MYKNRAFKTKPVSTHVDVALYIPRFTTQNTIPSAYWRTGATRISLARALIWNLLLLCGELS